MFKKQDRRGQKNFDGPEQRQVAGCFENSHKLPRSLRRGEILVCLGNICFSGRKRVEYRHRSVSILDKPVLCSAGLV